MLSANEKAQLQKVLQAALAKLARTGQSALSYSMNHERNIGRDSIDESMEEEIFSTEMRLHDREKFLLNEIKKRIIRLENGSIDTCDDCGELISFRRLMARPVTTLCIDCKEQAERDEKALAQTGRGISAEEGGAALSEDGASTGSSGNRGGGGGGADFDRMEIGIGQLEE